MVLVCHTRGSAGLCPDGSKKCWQGEGLHVMWYEMEVPQQGLRRCRRTGRHLAVAKRRHRWHPGLEARQLLVQLAGRNARPRHQRQHHRSQRRTANHCQPRARRHAAATPRLGRTLRGRQARLRLLVRARLRGRRALQVSHLCCITSLHCTVLLRLASLAQNSAATVPAYVSRLVCVRVRFSTGVVSVPIVLTPLSSWTYCETFKAQSAEETLRHAPWQPCHRSLELLHQTQKVAPLKGCVNSRV